MSQESSKLTKPKKYCGQCGQKNFRPNRSLKELFVEFVEDWLGYDSKIYKTAAKLCKPAALSLDYFANSHHKNHYITPIRLYLLLSIIFFVLTKFGGFNVTEIEIEDISPQASQEQKAQALAELQEAKQEVDSEQAKAIIEQVAQGIKEDLKSENTDPTEANQQTDGKPDDQGVQITVSGDTDFSSQHGCMRDPAEFVNLWPGWLDRQFDQGAEELCQSYANILYLPKDEQKSAKKQWGLSLAQKAIELIPQTFFLSLPLLALFLGVFYFLSRRLYVEHLVLLMHSHSFMFAAILMYLGWYQLATAVTSLQIIPVEEIFGIGIIVYLFLSQKWFYQRGWWATLWRFSLFGLIYIVLICIILLCTALVGILLG
ncbi:hypothetical protein [Kangiella sp. TOML190]|uniref:hypothetical protein n=1 Tax=Kangiella sp. TOML190 TaxID=2931351 RepID=UPI00203BAF7A|nr:hypothetical protein [Kangiella sp. TOML190]